MNKGSDPVEGKSGDVSSSRNNPAETQNTAPAPRGKERVAEQSKQKTKAGTSARKRRPPFVL